MIETKIRCEFCGTDIGEAIPPYMCSDCLGSYFRLRREDPDKEPATVSVLAGREDMNITIVKYPFNGEHQTDVDELIAECIKAGLPAHSCSCGCTTVTLEMI